MTGVAHSRLAPPAWLRLPRRTARLRLTALYGGLFLLSGVALVATTYVLFERATAYRTPHLPTISHTPAIQNLQLPFPPGQGLPPHGHPIPLPAHPLQLAQAQYELTQAQQELANAQPGRFVAVPTGLAKIRHQLDQAEHQLAQGQRQLADAVHQVAQTGTVQAAQRAADSHELLVNSAIALAIVAVLAVLAGWLVAGRMLRPIRTITRTVRRISSTSLHERLALDGPQDELKELGDTLDDLFARLDAAFEAQRHFVANASHELRAPLTRQRALIQVALADPDANFTSLRTAHERALASEQHLEQMIDALLTLTRGQAGLERHEHVDLAGLASQALLARESEAADRDLDVRATLATAPAAGDPRLLERLVTNLLDNAIRHNTPGGHVEITTGTRDRHAFLTITNTGPTIPPEQIQRLFQPFQRLGGARTQHKGGHGLGLSIVQAIATAHRAELITRARPQGGLTIEVSFPPATGANSTTPPPLPRRNAAARAPVSETDAPAGG